ncbi:histidine kinase [Lewinellaceae bacterium SD302]|nr:histidine kinase [Lewinellaceae bacterium SD302]
MSKTPSTSELVAKLASFEVFANVEPEPLEWLVRRSTCRVIPKGEYIFREGDTVDHLQVIMKGKYVLRYERKGRKRELGIWGEGQVTGVLPFSRMTESGADSVVLKECTLLELHRDHFVEMIRESYSLTQALVAVMTSRVRDFQQMQLMDEKLMALGKMSAGLAHELNNPASAMVRSSQELRNHLGQTAERFRKVITMRVTPEDADRIASILVKALESYDKSELSLLEEEALKDDLIDWLDDHNVERSEDLADTLVEFEFGEEQLEEVASFIPPESVGTVLWWLATNLDTERIVSEIHTASCRIGDLVKSIKTYSHMDEEPSMDKVDVNAGLKSTLTMLKFRFKKGNVSLEKDLDFKVPKIMALAGELNQVWTNLIVNALDAMPEKDPKLTLRTFQERDCVCVEIEDNGSGIPKDIQSRIFEPFFTTKGIGEGTGMGLDIVKRVIERHNGTIQAESTPGRTCFRACFPIHQEL